MRKRGRIIPAQFQFKGVDMAKPVSDKSTKTEILDAYQELLVKLKEQKAQDAKAVKKEAEEKEVVRAAVSNSVEGIVKRHADLKLEIVKSMDSLEEKLIAEFRRLTELEQAIAVETNLLEELFQIKAEAETLAALVAAQDQKKQSFAEDMETKKADFETEMSARKSAWKKEQEEYEAAKKERDSQTKKERQREEEEYEYDLNLKRKKEADAYAARKTAMEKDLTEKKAAFEKDVEEREKSLAAREKELEDLRTRVESFPKELDKTVRETEKAVMDRIEFKYKYQAELTAKEIEGERRLAQQAIAALEKKISEQEEQVRQLTQRASEAGLQVQQIAIKAIEGAGTTRIITPERQKET
jgi:hypothetical protein